MNRQQLILSTLGIAFMCLVGADAFASDLNRTEIEVETADVPGSDVPEVTVRGIVDAKAETVWALLRDCGDFDRIFSDIKSAELVDEEGDVDICRETVSMPFPLADMTAVTRVRYEVKDGTWLRKWTLVRGDYEMNSGSWRLEAIDGGERTLAEYTLHADPEVPVPDWLRERVQEQSMPKVIEELRRAASSD